MKRLACLPVVVVAVFVTAGLDAGPWDVSDLNTGDVIKLYDGPGTTNGGVFRAKDASTVSPDDWFWTFCMERDEYITLGASYTVVLNTKALNGGVNTDTGDTISQGTAFLFEIFWNTPTAEITDSLANQFQRAFWYLEDEVSDASYLSTQVKDWLTAGLGTSDVGVWKSDYDPSASTVRVLNLYDSAGRFAQDQLVSVPVPEPTVLGLLGVATLALGAGRLAQRRRRGA